MVFAMAAGPPARPALGTGVPVFAAAPPALAAPLPLLTNISALRQLSPLKAERGYPARVSGVATYCGRDGTLFVQDSTAGIWVDRGNIQLDVQHGLQLELEGVSGRGDFAPIFKASGVRVLGMGADPPGQLVRLEDLLTGNYDSQWVQFEGVVRSMANDNGHLVLSVALSPAVPARPCFEIASAHQGEEGLELDRAALGAGRPYSMAFVDVRLPPGWDGIETTVRLWEIDPDLVICSAYTDYSWDELTGKLGCSDRFVILKKPFEPVEVLQLATALTEKWRLGQESKQQLLHLEREVTERTRELQSANANLAAVNQELESALAKVKTLSGLLPICSGCKRIRDDQGYWNQIESYIQQHSDARLTHGFCPDFAAHYFPGLG